MNTQHHSAVSALTCLAAVVALSACGGGADEPSGPTAVALNFAAMSGTTPIRCGTPIAGLGANNWDAQLKDFRFYVSAVKFVKSDGSKVDLTLGANDNWNLTSGTNAVTLIDLEDGTGACVGGTAETNARVAGTVPAGNYVGVEFTVGVPPALNHSDYANAVKPLDVQAMAWSWQSGRKFAKIEVTDPAGTAGTWTAKVFNVHLGSTGCVGNPATGETVACATPNRMAVAFNNFNPSGQKIAVDIKTLLAGTDITRNQAGAAGCMSGGTDPECLKVFDALAIHWKSDGTGTGQPINAGAAQTVFRAIAQ